MGKWTFSISHFQLLSEVYYAALFNFFCFLVSGISSVLKSRPQRFIFLICRVTIFTWHLHWTQVPHHLYKFPLMLTSSSSVIFNQRKLQNAPESLVALQYWTESNQVGGKRARKGRHQAKQQTTQQSAEKRSGEVKRGENSWLQDVGNLSPPPQIWKMTVGLQGLKHLVLLTKKYFSLHGTLNSHPAVLQSQPP